MAGDPNFLSVTRQEMADAMNFDPDDMENSATDLLNGRRGRVVKRKKQPALSSHGSELSEPSQSTTPNSLV